MVAGEVAAAADHADIADEFGGGLAAELPAGKSAADSREVLKTRIVAQDASLLRDWKVEKVHGWRRGFAAFGRPQDW
ncbi:MAG: hypothetical protein H5U19_08255 [Rhodobacteraceae bacterium]|nr:hypothetical protein [Paracoccaceae bacterium]